MTQASNLQLRPKHRQMPADFELVAPGKSKNQLMQIYRTSYPALGRWLDQAGISATSYVRPKRAAVPAARANLPVQRNRTLHDFAADALRRERFMVNPCNDKGGYDRGGQYWRVGYSILTPDELLVRAAKYQVEA